MTTSLFAPRFWWDEGAIGGLALSPIGAIYGRIASWRMEQAGQRADLPVICVGNFTVGGAGKTPTVLALADLCRDLSLKPVFLTRGFGGREPGPVLVDPERHKASDVGDEALLLARKGQTIVAVDRVAGADMAKSLPADVILMDDGFQNPSLEKDFSLLVVDAGRGAGNGRIFPAGPLRAPLTDQMRRADAVLIIGEGQPGNTLVRAAARAATPFMSGHFEPTGARLAKSKDYLAFAGIARPSKFYETLKAAGLNVTAEMDFPDHHTFSQSDCREILDRAAQSSLRIVTTEKDYVRLTGQSDDVEELAKAARPFPVQIVFRDRDRLRNLVATALKPLLSAR